jgi:hypothetical protein
MMIHDIVLVGNQMLRRIQNTMYMMSGIQTAALFISDEKVICDECSQTFSGIHEHVLRKKKDLLEFQKLSRRYHMSC